MAAENREFNPLGYRLIVDRDVDDESVVNVDAEQTSWPEIPMGSRNQLSQVQRLDGIIVASETMQIAKNCGVLQFFQFPAVTDRHLNRFKGLKDFFGTNTRHLYEFSLCGLGAGVTLCAVIATHEVVSLHERPNFAKMVKEYHNYIRRCITNLPPSRMTRQLNLAAPKVPIQIYKDDWKEVCENLCEELRNAATDFNGQNVFPKSPKFYWITKLLGQNLSYEEDNIDEILGAYKFAIDLDIGHRFAVTIHCAVDTELKDHVLFWNPNIVAKSFGNVKPAVLYHVALLPGLANMTYADVNRSNFSYVQYYSRLWSGCHRDSSNAFLYNGISRSLYNRYCRKLGNSATVKSSPKDLFIDDADGKLTLLLKGLKECCDLTNPARVEAVWTMPETCDVSNGITEVIRTAFQDFNLATHDATNPFYKPAMLVNIATSTFSSRIVPWIDIIECTVKNLAESVKLVENQETLWNLRANLIIPAEKFCCTQVAELLLHMIIKGRLHKSYPSELPEYLGIEMKFLADYANYELLCGIWPFSNTTVNSDNSIEAEHPHELQEKLYVLSGIELKDNRFISFAETRKRYCALPEAQRKSRSYQNTFEDLADHLLELILYIQKSKTSDSNWGEVTLKMLILEKIDFSRKVKHYNTSDFIQLLAYPEVFGKRLPMFPETRELTNIFDVLKEEVTRFSGFRTVLNRKLQEKMKAENCPLRFSYGKLHEIYVHFNLGVFPSTEESLKCLDRALIDANKCRATSSTVSIKDIVGHCKTFLAESNFANLAEVAAAAQDIFDYQRIKTIRKIPPPLRTRLQDLMGISNGDDTMQNDDVSSDEGEEGLDENLEPTPVSLPGTSTEGNTSSNNRATAGPSKTWKRKKYDEDEPRSRRSRTTSESMKKLWAQRRANNPNPQNSKQK